MLTKNDLKAIAKTIRPLIKAEGDLIRKDMVTKNDLRVNNGIMGEIFRIELSAQKHEIAKAMKTGFREMVKVIRRLKELYDARLEEHEKRIEKFEKQHLS